MSQLAFTSLRVERKMTDLDVIESIKHRGQIVHEALAKACEGTGVEITPSNFNAIRGAVMFIARCGQEQASIRVSTYWVDVLFAPSRIMDMQFAFRTEDGGVDIAAPAIVGILKRISETSSSAPSS